MESMISPEMKRLSREVVKSKHIKTSTRVIAAGFYVIIRVCDFIDWLFPVPV
jgi:hypothetical protein